MGNLLNCDCRLSIREVADTLSINHETVCLTVKKLLQLWKLGVKLVLKLLSAEQTPEQTGCIWTENILERIITCDESWIFEYDPETKRQSMQLVSKCKGSKKAGCTNCKWRQWILRVWPNLWGGNSLLFLQDNELADNIQNLQFLHQKFSQCNPIQRILPCVTFFLFLDWKITSKDTYFDSRLERNFCRSFQAASRNRNIVWGSL